MHPTDLTVAAVIETNGRFLLVEEHSSGRRVLSQPGGHIETGESPEQALVREVLEETACDVRCGELVGVYLWIHPRTRQQYLRIVYAAEYLGCQEDLTLDNGIIGRRWLTLRDIESRQSQLRTPAVLRCVHDYIAGRRQPERLLTDMLPLQQNVDRVLAAAHLI